MTTWGRPARRHDRADGYDDYYADDSGRDPYGTPTAAPSRPGRGAPRRDGLVVRGLRALSGVVCGAVIVLTVVVWAAQYLGDKRDFPGPGSASLSAHVVAVVVASAAQVFADRRRGLAAAVGAGVVYLTGAVLMFTQWWG
ncbi:MULTISPECIES: hypothetical protein [Rhodococcus]|jgi:hypothetical protein|uniref:hypothetical protein n=1 Tax=Rhodococcus TaxID=1827 RepID=UPI00193B911D|nr:MULTISPECIES: hypothetical protein [Rhodococcus]QRI75224.1 hypothetical protein JQ505_22200 [Rhodococcus aetherivorans]QSE58633.1 hypothetical protein JYA75_23305 [Rhodococcus sp. PSBB066]QSE70043.1 hypothetical protein JYA91_04315 [Rhodococcus sp. PSBB049]